MEKEKKEKIADFFLKLEEKLKLANVKDDIKNEEEQIKKNKEKLKLFEQNSGIYISDLQKIKIRLKKEKAQNRKSTEETQEIITKYCGVCDDNLVNKMFSILNELNMYNFILDGFEWDLEKNLDCKFEEKLKEIMGEITDSKETIQKFHLLKSEISKLEFKENDNKQHNIISNSDTQKGIHVINDNVLVKDINLLNGEQIEIQENCNITKKTKMSFNLPNNIINILVEFSDKDECSMTEILRKCITTYQFINNIIFDCGKLKYTDKEGKEHIIVFA